MRNTCELILDRFWFPSLVMLAMTNGQNLVGECEG